MAFRENVAAGAARERFFSPDCDILLNDNHKKRSLLKIVLTSTAFFFSFFYKSHIKCVDVCVHMHSNLITAASKQAICHDAVTRKYQLGLIPKKAKSESNEPLDATARSHPYILTTPTNAGLWLCILLKLASPTY